MNLGGKEALEDSLHVLRFDSCTVVTDRDYDPFGIVNCGCNTQNPRPIGDCIHCLECVYNQIQHDLLQPSAIR